MSPVSTAAADSHGAMVAGGRTLAIAALVTWLLAESLGAYMLRNWLTRSRVRDQRAGTEPVSRPVMFSHAGLALTGFISWVVFLLTGAGAAAWISVALLAPAIGLGVSTVTIWTPYPGGGAGSGPGDQAWSSYGADTAASAITDEAVTRALADETLSDWLVDDLLARMLAPAPPPPRRRRWQLQPLIPVTHGLLAVATFLLAALAAIAATR